MPRPVWAEVDLNAIKANLAAVLSGLTPGTRLMAVVKANAYGHGLIPVAEAALEAGATRLGVALVEEAAELRAAGINAPIQLLSEPTVGAAGEVAAFKLIPAVYSVELAEALSGVAVSAGTTVKVHLKVDTGMHRVGLPPARALELYESVSRLPNLEVEGFFTHFACADNPDDPYTAEQLASFLELKEALPQVPLWHAANSAAAIFLPDTHLDMVRIGIAMYGLQPAVRPAPFKLRPALALKTKVSFVQELQPGEGVSYGLTYRAKEKVSVATLPIGYGDGYSRLLSNKGEVLIGGQRVKIVGSVCMDQCSVELGKTTPAAPGDEAVLIGVQGSERITAEELASIIGTINYEVVCMINKRVARLYR